MRKIGPVGKEFSHIYIISEKTFPQHAMREQHLTQGGGNWPIIENDKRPSTNNNGLYLTKFLHILHYYL